MRTATSQKEIARLVLDAHSDAPLSSGEHDYLQRHARRYAVTLKLLAAIPTGAVLDVGCFPGHLALAAGRLGWKVTGLGMPAQAIGDPGFEARMARRSIRVFHADIERDLFPFADSSYDAVFFNESIEHLAFNPYHALDEIWRVLKPGGWLLFSVPNLASFDHRWAMLLGRTIYPLLTGGLTQTFHADLAQRHVREYTRRECRYLLEEQDKYLYRFEIQRLVMDRSWDGLFHSTDGVQIELNRIRPGTLLRAVACRFVPALRSNIIILARKTAAYHRLDRDRIHWSGFFNAERAGTGFAFIRREISARWMSGQSRIAIDLAGLSRPLRAVQVLMWLPAPPQLPPRRIQVFYKDRMINSFTVAPSPEPQLRVLADGLERILNRHETSLDLRLATTGWRPSAYGATSDSRELGVMFGSDRVALITA